MRFPCKKKKDKKEKKKRKMSYEVLKKESIL